MRTTVIVEYNVGAYGQTTVSTIEERVPSARNPLACTYTHGFEPGPYPSAASALVIHRPEQYPLWKAMLAPGICSAMYCGPKREQIAIYAAYWERCGAHVEWPRKMRMYRAYARNVAEKIYARATCRADMMVQKAEQANPLTMESDNGDA